MATWTIAAVQMDCRLGDKPRNLDAMRRAIEFDVGDLRHASLPGFATGATRW